MAQCKLESLVLSTALLAIYKTLHAIRIMMKIFTTFLLGTLCFTAVAQDTTYFDAGWKSTTKADSKYFRVQTKEGNLWTRSDYWSMNKQLQMKGNLSSLEPELKEGYYE